VAQAASPRARPAAGSRLPEQQGSSRRIRRLVAAGEAKQPVPGACTHCQHQPRSRIVAHGGPPGWGLHHKADGGELSAGHRGIPPVVPTTHPAADPFTVLWGCRCSACLENLPCWHPKRAVLFILASCHRVPTGTWGLTILTYFPRGCSKA